MSGLLGGGSKASGKQPALGALKVQQSSYGTPVTLVYGTNRISGNLIWYGGFNSQQVSSGAGKGGGGSGGGGKGGGGGTYQYYASLAIGLCQGTVTGIGQVFMTRSLTNLAALNGALFTGASSQAPWGYLTSNFPADALGYNNLAYVGFPNLSLGDSAETPNFSFVVNGLFTTGPASTDVHAEQVIPDFLNRSMFPGSYIGSFAALGTYCAAMGFFISPIVDEQQAASEYLQQWMATLNAEFVWSNGVLTAVPYGDGTVTGNGVTYTPNLTPVYDLTDDDFIRDGDDDPVMCERTDLADCYNQQPIEYVNRNNSYNVETYTAEDAAHIDMYGVRTATTLQAHHVTDPNAAQQMAYLALWRGLYVRSVYTFKLGWSKILLDPMDLVTLTDDGLGLDRALVRITEIEEDENGLLSVTAEEVPDAVGTAALYQNQNATRFQPNYNVASGNANAPVIFEPPLLLIQSTDVEVWIAASGAGASWGGCNVWISTDDETYTLLGKVVGAPRQGLLTAALPAYMPGTANSIDSTHTLSVNLAESRGTLNGSATPTDAALLNTLCYVDGELLAYGGQSLTGQSRYDLSVLNRGAYGSTIGAHAAGSQFARLDDTILKVDFDQTRVGQTIYVKLQAFNQFGGGVQSLAEVGSYSYVLTGAAVRTPLGNPSGLLVYYQAGIANLSWTAISDIRAPVYYEIRQGTSFANSQVIGRTSETSFSVFGTGTYWVSALYFTPTGYTVYSVSPPSIGVTTASVQQNVLGSYDEAGASWPGTCSGGAAVAGSTIQLQATGNVLASSNVLAESDLLNLGGLSMAGLYTPPSGHTISSSYVVTAKVIINWLVAGQSLQDNILAANDVLSMQDVLGQQFQAQVYAQPQIRLSQDGGTTWGAWQNWVPGDYTFNAIQFRIGLFSASNQVVAILEAFSYSVDVPLTTDSGTSTTMTGGDTTVTYSDPFNVAPLPQITIQNASAGDDVILTAQSVTGFTFSVLNSGSRVARTVNWSATSY